MMTENNTNNLKFSGKAGELMIHDSDVVAKKLRMLIDGACNGLGAKKAAQKYGYTRQSYYHILADYNIYGTDALKDKKRGPKGKSVRTEVVINQIIRNRFLDPEASCEVIAQKLNQTGFGVSKRSVERTITEYGLQKKSSTG
jgi:transposase